MTEVDARTKHYNSLVSKIAEFRCNDEFCDIDVNVDGKVFKCHKLVLCAASKYFYRIFSGMLNESSSKEIILSACTETNVFEEILKFIYTGDASVIDTSNVFDVIRQADNYNLTLMVKLCIKFVEDNLNALAEEILKIYSLAYRVGLIELVQILSRHIYQNFYYFSSRPEFSKMSFDSFIAVLNLIEAERIAVAHDVFLEGICTWIRHQENLTLVERRFYFDSLTKKLDFSKLSVEYLQYRIKAFMEEVLPTRSIDGDIDASNTIQTPTKSLHAYVSRNSEDGLSCGTSIFTLRIKGAGINNTTARGYMWVYSGELMGCSVDFMRNVHINDRLYSLRFKNFCENGCPPQTFQSGSLISMYPSMTLEPPPCILNKYDMCGMLDNIYVYNKNTPPIYFGDIENSGFSEKELTNGMYVYKRDIDQWFPMPAPNPRFDNACMTCDDEVVYLIGGTNSNQSVQVYDPRTQGWSFVSPTTGTYDRAACCAYGKKIYVAGGQCNPKMLEVYDPISGNWLRLKDSTELRTDEFQLVYFQLQFEGRKRIVSFERKLSADSTILRYHPGANNRRSFIMPNLFNDASNTKLPFSSLSILDMVNF